MKRESKEFLAALASFFPSARAFDEFLKHWGGCSRYIPKPQSLNLEARNAEIRQEFSQGATYQKLAREYGVGTRQIRNITATTKKNKAA